MDLASGVRVRLRQPVPPRVTVTIPTTRIQMVPVRGATGPQGVAGGNPVLWDQSTPAATWTIPHGLGRLPTAVEVILADGEVVDTDTHVDDTYVVLTFAQPTAGTAQII